MNIGIITFHWATNYGAVLQAYALQEALNSIGHKAEIINYKPTLYDDTLWSFLRFRKFMSFSRYLQERRKEARISIFRSKYLKQTKRYRSQNELRLINSEFDALITGSDQVLNESFLVNGEAGGSSAYFLDFGTDKTLRYAYAASFGSTDYPDHLVERVEPLVKRLNGVSSRERTGLTIFKKMGATNPVLVPDPTLLQKDDFYTRLLATEKPLEKKNRAYFLRGRENIILNTLNRLKVDLISDESIEQWLNAIRCSSHFITNSFHGVVFSLIFNTPFTVVLKTKENIGMNDRLYTLLEPLGLIDRIYSESDFNESSIDYSFDWKSINEKIDSIRTVGFDFLKQIY